MAQLALDPDPDPDPDKVSACFDHYVALEGNPITHAMAKQRTLEISPGA